MAFNPHPLAACAACLAVGIALAHFLLLPLGIVVVCGAVMIVLCVVSTARRNFDQASIFALIAFACAGAALGVAQRQVSASDDRVRSFLVDGRIASGDPVEVTGTVKGWPEIAPDGFYLALRAEKLRAKGEEHEAEGNIWLFAPVRDHDVRVEYESLQLRHAARVRVLVALEREDNFRNPGVASFINYLDERGFDAAGMIKSPLLVERGEDAKSFLPLLWLYEWRAVVLDEIERLFNSQTGGVLKASLLGNRYYLSRPVAERFREGGTFHVLVISGLHISFIGGLALLIMRRVTKRKAVQFLVCVLFLWSYALAVGAESSVVRAALMFTVMALAQVLHRPANALNALGAGVLLLLVWQPLDLFNASFQLTVMSVIAILLVAWPLLVCLETIGAWRPASETPYPPDVPRPWRGFAETLYWSERDWRSEMANLNYTYNLEKATVASVLERLRLQRVIRYAFSALVVSTSVQVVLLPLLALYFHRFSVASFALNIIVGFLMALLSLVAIAGIAVAQLSTTLAAPLILFAEWINWIMTYSVVPFNRLRISQVRVPEYNSWAAVVYILFYVPLGILIYRLALWRPLKLPTTAETTGGWRNRFVVPVTFLAFTLCLIIILAHPFSARQWSGKLRVDFLDVGQGDAALVTMPDGVTLLVDGGGRPRYAARQRTADEEEQSFEPDRRSIGEAVVAEYLWWRGLDQVDYLLATHAHADHIDGLNDIARNFRVRAALVARAPTDDEEQDRFARTLSEQGIAAHRIGAGDELRFGSIVADVLWPPRVGEESLPPSINDDSIVLRLRFGDKTILLTGDIEQQAERQLTVQSQALLGCDVVKVAHHGSNTSSTEEFVRATHPKFAVVSVGRRSPFGHPRPEVVERWRRSGAQVLTTGESGAITVITDGRDLTVESFVNERK